MDTIRLHSRHESNPRVPQGERGLGALALAVGLLGLLPTPARADGSGEGEFDALPALYQPRPVDGSSTARIPAGEEGGAALLVRARKIITAEAEGSGVIDNGYMVVQDGKIVELGQDPADSGLPLETLVSAKVVDAGEHWVMPGLVELHCHIAGSRDINDTVYLTNPGLRAYTSVRPDNPALHLGVAGGVTTVLFIPGSGSNMGGQGALLKTGLHRYEDMEVRMPGSLKIAQAGNPERWAAIRPGRTFMNWNTRNTLRRGLVYAKRWVEFEAGRGEKPEVDPQWELFRRMITQEVPISTHTQWYQVVLATIRIIRQELGLNVFIDHGTFNSYLLGQLANDEGVDAILGPRNIDSPTRGMINWTGYSPEKIVGVAAGFQQNGHTRIGFNTDSPVIPQEELSMQASMAMRYGMTNENLENIKGLTLVPARTAGILDRVGTLEPGKDADFIIVTGDVTDPRTAVEAVYIEGHKVYDTAEDRRRW